MVLKLASIQVECAFGYSLLGYQAGGVAADWGTDLDWTDITDYVRSVEVTRGRTDPKTDFSAGSARVVLSNLDGRFDPNYPDGAYCPACLQPNTPIRIRTQSIDLGEGATQYPVFFGVTGPWPATRQIKGDAIVTLQCFDLMKMLASYPIYGDFPAESTGTRIWRILDLAGWPPESVGSPFHRIYYGSMGQATCVATRLTGHTAAEHIMHCMRTEGITSAVAVQKGGALGFMDRHAVYSTPWSDLQATFGNDGVNLPYREIRWVNDERDFYNQVEVSIVSEGTAASVTVTTSVQWSTFGGGILAVEELTGDIPLGAVLDFGPGKCVTVLIAASAGDSSIFIDGNALDIPSGASTVWSPTTAIRASNPSQVQHGKRKLTRSNLLFASIDEAEAYAEDVLAEYLEPRARVDSLRLSGGVSDAVSLQMVGLGIGERIRISDQAPYMTEAVTSDFIVQGIRHSITLPIWETEIYTAPAPSDKVLSLLDDAATCTLGATATAGF